MDCNKHANRLRNRSRSLLTFTILTAALSQAHAQTFAEWFSQKKTQKKYLLQQIAALQIYSGYLKTGYSIAKGGLGNIGTSITNEFKLHDDHYKSLQTVNTAIKNDPQVNAILRWQQDILNQSDAIKKQEGLSDPEKDYTNKVCGALLADCDARMNDLQTILSDNKTEMCDEERIRQIARIYVAMQDNYRFAASFRSQLAHYVAHKTQEQNDNNTLKDLYAKR